VDFVDEQDRRFGVEEFLLAGRFQHLAHLLDARRDGRQGVERAFESRGNDLGQRSFSHARRTPEDERGDIARFEELAEYAVLPDQVGLSDIFIERTGTQSFGEGNGHGKHFLSLKCTENFCFRQRPD
jgi:hypothetical protein